MPKVSKGVRNQFGLVDLKLWFLRFLYDWMATTTYFSFSNGLEFIELCSFN